MITTFRISKNFKKFDVGDSLESFHRAYPYPGLGLTGYSAWKLFHRLVNRYLGTCHYKVTYRSCICTLRVYYRQAAL